MLLCHFPTRIMLVDDNQHFLQKLKRSLNPSLASYEISDYPQEAIDVINSESSFLTKLPPLSSDSIVQKWVDIISDEIHNPDRYKTISTVVVDYDMPGMSGLELCEKIESPHIQKILLTGAADEKIATKAFNEGLIHYYMRKEAAEVFDNLEAYIKQTQRRYFNSFYRPLLEFLKSDPSETAVSDPIFQAFFLKFLNEKKVIEYYLADPLGSYLYIDQNQNVGFFGVITQDYFDFFEMNLQDFLQQDYQQKVFTEEVIHDLRERKKIFYPELLHSNPSPEAHELAECIFPLNTVNGTHQTYYWFCVPKMPGY